MFSCSSFKGNGWSSWHIGRVQVFVQNWNSTGFGYEYEAARFPYWGARRVFNFGYGFIALNPR